MMGSWSRGENTGEGPGVVVLEVVGEVCSGHTALAQVSLKAVAIRRRGPGAGSGRHDDEQERTRRPGLALSD